MATTFTVPDGRVAMAATLYTGNGSTNTISNAINAVGMQPDLLWTKARSTTAYHYLQDSVRGVNKALYSNDTLAEGAITTTTTTLNTTGFAFNGAESGLNANAATFVAWQWKAGGTAVSNTAGTITSSVSANTTAGFSVVTFTTPNLAAGATVGHGLGVVPSFIIVKGRNLVSGWQGYHVSLGGTKRVLLNTTDAATTDSGPWNNTAPTSTVITLGGSFLPDTTSSYTYVAYCWAPVAGYSAFGSYTGNGIADGPFIYTGFRPRWIMVKATTAATAYSWVVLDSSRNTYNLADFKLLPNSSVVENDAGAIGGAGVNAFDLVSNGFKSRTSNLSTNESGTTYIYAAFAENPLKYANAR